MGTRVRINNGINWVVEDAGIRVFGSPIAPGRFIAYPEAAVWDFLSRAYTIEVIVSRLRRLDRRLAPNADSWVESVLMGWIDVGLIVGEAD